MATLSNSAQLYLSLMKTQRKKKKYMIVGDVEADVKRGRISISSPIARALIGKSVGDSVEVTAPGGARGYEITQVQFG